jgi:hypothetical protein
MEYKKLIIEMIRACNDETFLRQLFIIISKHNKRAGN